MSAFYCWWDGLCILHIIMTSERAVGVSVSSHSTFQHFLSGLICICMEIERCLLIKWEHVFVNLLRRNVDTACWSFILQPIWYTGFYVGETVCLCQYCLTIMLSLLQQIMVMSDGTSFSGQSLHLPSLSSNSLSFPDTKKKSSHGPKVRLILPDDT